MTGILCVDKPPGPTSHDVVAVARRALGVRRIGHFGTLDPFASGLLVCGVGPATRLAPFCVGHDKTYVATVRLGWTSTTDDAEGELHPTGAAPAERDAVEAACARWVGTVEQVPPSYSAKHVAGERAYARARAGETVVLPAARVRIDRIGIDGYEWPDLDVTIECGPGTYVRALARDIGEELGTGAFCAALRRVRSGPFTIADAIGWEDLRDPARAEGALQPAEAAVMDLPRAELDETAAAAVAQGRAVPAPTGVAPDAGWVRLVGPRGFVGVGERESAPGGDRLRPRKILYPEGESAWPPGVRTR